MYDAFYPGYGDSWPTFQGSIGMTYEQASARSLAFARSDGDTLTYRDGVMHHFNAAITTAITAARNRERLVRDFLEYRRSAVAEGEKGPIREYMLVPGHDPSRAEKLARNLATQGIEVRRAEEPIKLATRQLPAGTYIVSNAQPTGAADPEPARSEDRAAGGVHQAAGGAPQDAAATIRSTTSPRGICRCCSTWRLVTSPTAITVKATPVPSQYDAPSRRGRCAASKVGYLMPWGAAASRLSADALRQGIRIRSVGGAFTLNGRAYPIGTALIRNAENPADLTRRLTALAASTAPRSCRSIPPISTRAPRSAATSARLSRRRGCCMAWDAPTASLSAGWTRYVLERRFGRRRPPCARARSAAPTSPTTT